MLISKWEDKKNEKCSDEAKMRPIMANLGKITKCKPRRPNWILARKSAFGPADK